ncbi:triose-phosphate isomerase, partial [bacterium]|nr:triose-phosphate isomerase [bacterium]
MKRIPFYGGNWKMNHALAQTEAYLQDFVNYAFPDSCEIVLFPPFTSFHLMQKYLGSTPISFGAQNFYFEESGAFTGEVSLSMLKDMGCTHVLTGHSERREIFGETDEMVRKKTIAALDLGLVPMVCVGETLEERQRGGTAEKIRSQVEAALQGMSEADTSKLLFAYEPIWAIGTGVNASQDDAREGIATVRGVLRNSYSDSLAQKIRIVYGGSVKPENIATYMREEGI